MRNIQMFRRGARHALQMAGQAALGAHTGEEAVATPVGQWASQDGSQSGSNTEVTMPRVEDLRQVYETLASHINAHNAASESLKLKSSHKQNVVDTPPVTTTPLTKLGLGQITRPNSPRSPLTGSPNQTNDDDAPLWEQPMGEFHQPPPE